MPNHWIGVASRDHVRKGVDGGFAQLGHGKHSAVKSLGRGDWIVYYSPRTSLNAGEPVKAFTAIGKVTSHEPYEFEMSPQFKPFRVDVDFVKPAREVPIHDLLADLDLTRDRGSNWGIVMRRSRIKVSQDDFARIAAAMGVAMEP